MSEFRTRLPALDSTIAISHHDTSLCIGSCFTENIGAWLQMLKFPCLLNPFGILYNPVSIGKSFLQLLHPQPYQLEDLQLHGELWHSFDHHGAFSQPDAAQALEQINTSLNTAATFAQSVNRLILTPGTAHVYTLRKAGAVVANCHKFPAADFEKRRLSVDEIVTALAAPIEQWKAARPDLEVILTVSPVRHIRDGIVENQRSKATLVLALEVLCEQFDFVHYFPAYELLLDDLRDYRFYEADMIHPNSVAIQYIRDYFAATYFSENTRALNQRIAKIITAAQHRPLHAGTAAQHTFAQQQLAAMATLVQEFPFLDFEKERTHFEKLQ